MVNREEDDRDILKLLATPARVRFLSIEPMLGPVKARLAVPTSRRQHRQRLGRCRMV